MTAADWVVIGIALALLGFLGWYFFGPRKSSLAELRDGVQEIEIVVRGGYSPDIIRVRQGTPVRLVEAVLLLAFLGLSPVSHLLGGAFPPAGGWALAAMAIPVMILADTAHKAWRAKRAPGSPPASKGSPSVVAAPPPERRQLR